MLPQTSETRKLVLSHLIADQVDPVDIDRINQDDWFIERYLLDKELDGDQDCVKSAAESIVKCLYWRKENNINGLSDSDFPIECHQKPGIVIDEAAKILYFRIAFCLPVSELTEMTTKYLLFKFEQFDRIVGRERGTLIFDYKGATLGNMNIGVGKSFPPLLTKYYPLIASKMIVVDLHFLIRPIVRFFVFCMPNKFSAINEQYNRQELKEVLGEDTPTFMGGSKLVVTPLPTNLRSLEEIARLNDINCNVVPKYLKYFNEINNDN